MAGCVIASSFLRRSGSAKTMSPTFLRSSVPSGSSTSPNSRTISASAGSPGATTSRASTSASMMTPPRRRKISDTVLLPVAMPPVRPTRRKRGSLSVPSSYLGPVGAGLYVDDDGHRQRQRLFHDVARERLQHVHLLGRRLEEQLVVHLQQHAGAQA